MKKRDRIGRLALKGGVFFKTHPKRELVQMENETKICTCITEDEELKE
jgi:hypothetical protein